ncbi:YncE family protein [Umezawaea tangerina]|uniref:YVTN family beta-propeller protein n=1 Tax=Umezawaea tangerina TaxID=84725 RepID=A0A2T0TJR3_9PSEU|nr:cytochrome D1 domain-containing protein [Umezawaea tangerina]PRY45859.1 YVTN family beta-propeller protein [Umezawaea tangerina]
MWAQSTVGPRRLGTAFFSFAALFALSAAPAALADGPPPAVDPAASGPSPQAYVVGRSGQVQVVDTVRGKVLATARTGGRTTGVAVAPDGGHVYVVNGWTGVITAIDPATGAVVGRLETGTQLAQAVMHPDGQRLYVTGNSSRGGSVVVVDPRTFTLAAVVPLGGQVQGVTLSPDGRMLYVAGAQDGTVALVDALTLTPQATVEIGGMPQHVAVSPDGSTLYASVLHLGARKASAGLVVVDTKRRTRLAEVPVGTGAGGVAVTPDGSRVYVALTRQRAVAVVDTTTRTLLRTLPYDARGLSNAPGDRRIFLATGSTTTVLDGSDDTELARFDLDELDLPGITGKPTGFEATMVAFAPDPSH